MPERLLLSLIDGSSYLYRAFYAIRHLSTSRGVPTNAVYGFVNMLLKVLREKEPAFIGVAFDPGGPTVRHEVFTAYKANRPPIPPSLEAQIPYVQRVVEAFQIPCLIEKGYEADDVLGTLALKAAGEGLEVTLITGDKDFLQLVSPSIQVYDAAKEKVYGEEEVRERYGVEPRAIPDLLALMGDPVDNIPGVPGVGEKTARVLLQQFGTVEGLLAQLSDVEPPRLYEAIRAYAEQLRVNRDLVTIRTDLAFPLDLQALQRREPDGAALAALFQELEFSSLMKRLGLKEGKSTQQPHLF